MDQKTFNTLKETSEKMTVWSIIGVIVGVGLAIYTVTFVITYMTEQYRLVSNPENNARIKALALAKLENRYLGHGRSTLSNGPVARMPENQRLLINTDVFSCRYAGYLGPLANGIYSEDDAVRIACEAGVRLFVVEVGMMKDHVSPVLVARNSAGAHVGNTYGSLKAVASALRTHGFAYGRSDPLMVYIHVHEYPNIGTEPKNYFAFCSTLATQLGPLESHFLTDSSRGPYSRQGREADLFYTPVKEFSKSVILMTNLDTTCFRKSSDYGIDAVKPAQDLDFMVHVRVYGEADKTDKKPTAFVSGPSYWLSTPQSMASGAQKATKEAFTIVLDDGLSADSYKRLRETYGVQSTAFGMFADEIDYMIGPDSVHYRDSWVDKPDNLRFKPAEPIIIKPADPRMDGNKGVLNTPTL